MTSADFYLLVSTVSLALLSLFGVVALIYLILILRRVHLMMDSIENFFQHWGGSFKDIVARVQSVKNTAEILAQGIKHVTEIYQERKSKPKKKKTE